MSETLPEVVADYLEAVPGQIMLEDAIWFRWSLEERRVTVSGNTNTLTPEQMTAHPKKDAFERVIQALIFTIIIKAMNIGLMKLWWVT